MADNHVLLNQLMLEKGEGWSARNAAHLAWPHWKHSKRRAKLFAPQAGQGQSPACESTRSASTQNSRLALGNHCTAAPASLLP